MIWKFFQYFYNLISFGYDFSFSSINFYDCYYIFNIDSNFPRFLFSVIILSLTLLNNISDNYPIVIEKDFIFTISFGFILWF